MNSILDDFLRTRREPRDPGPPGGNPFPFPRPPRGHRPPSQIDLSRAEVNWSNMASPARNQGRTEACVAMAIAAVIEANLRISGKVARLSPASLQYCRNGGPNKTWAITKGLDAVKEHGIISERCMPWNTRGGCNLGRFPDWQSRALTIAGYEKHKDREDRMAALRKGPVLGYVNYYDSLKRQYSGSIYRANGIGRNSQHAVAILGYDKSQKVWIVQNSYPEWGNEKGIGLIAFDDENLQLDTRWAFYSVKGINLPDKFSTPCSGRIIPPSTGGLSRERAQRPSRRPRFPPFDWADMG